MTHHREQRERLCILFVTFADCVHTARWIAQLHGLGWELHLLPFTHHTPHPELRGVTVHRLVTGPRTRSVAPQSGISWPFGRGETRVTQLLEKFDRYTLTTRLRRLIRAFKPDIVHSLGMQAGGYEVLAARQRIGPGFPTWIHSSWGSDYYFFGEVPDHQGWIREVLQHCEYITADCQRDVQLARKFGFAGEVLGVFPGGGGFALQEMRALRQPGPVRSRRVIAIKGYQDEPAGSRALVALEALRRCAPLLCGYEVAFYSAAPKVRAAGEEFARSSNVRVTFPPPLSHADMARLFGSARIGLGLATTDGTPNVMLEAMIMGAFPIQSDTISTGEWVQSGSNGLLVPPEDPDAVAEAIRRALTDDLLVERAAEINTHIADERLERESIRREVIALYQRAACRRKTAASQQMNGAHASVKAT